MPARRSVTALAATALGAALLLSGCGGSGSSTTATDGGPSMPMSVSPGDHLSMSSKGSMSDATITVEDFAFTGPATVAAGSTVTVTNKDPEAHSVTADGAGGFDVTVSPGASTTFTAPSRPGSYAYHCMFHSDMQGTLKVR